MAKRGGARAGSGRPVTDLKIPLGIRISKEAASKLENVKNKSAIIDELIKQYL